MPTLVHQLKFQNSCYQHTLFKFITASPSTWNAPHHNDYISHALLDDKVPWNLIHNMLTFNYCNLLLVDNYIYSTF